MMFTFPIGTRVHFKLRNRYDSAGSQSISVLQFLAVTKEVFTITGSRYNIFSSEEYFVLDDSRSFLEGDIERVLDA